MGAVLQPMMYLKAIDPHNDGTTIHAADAQRRAQTLCLRSTTWFNLSDEDWEQGSQRLSCAVCVDVVASFHQRRSLIW